ncbi:lipopolysaccharide heptosyltransferase I [Helicobacter sp. 13S00401-1]|uniref:lipopolysaccharide heptosyltransferase I n=1 Tax=Helicobacter sp. 13S00401-1 TaxID=1905758 RepID=UPI000BA64DC7|nr:lipopolysaccharide heptosyltransferase I [Helicobacter sp. 13S00401-1]PAF51362.1 lipopolysaccharide heptosyltransferase I [Helicobacter sp. 13S00401-1]
MRVAIIRVSALGDVIISASFLHAFKEALESKFDIKQKDGLMIEWFVDVRFSGVLENSPCITKLHALPFKKLFRSLGGILELRRYCKSCKSFDYVIDAQGLIKSSLIGKFLDSKNFIGFDKASSRESLASFFYKTKVHIPYKENILVRNKTVLFNPFGINIDVSKALSNHKLSFGCNIPKAKEVLKEALSALEEEASFKVLFVLETSKATKTYPIESFLNLAKLLGSFKNISIFLIWHDDEERARRLFTSLQDSKLKATLLPSMDFNAIKYLISSMECVIGGDTGITHLAWALNSPSITLFGNVESGLSGSNLSKTPLSRVLLRGEKNLYVSNKTKVFGVESIEPSKVYETFKQIYLT